ncbi:unnamed protein product [Sphagnum balticum]
MYQEGDMVSDDEDGVSDELSTPYASAHSSPARLQSSPEEEEADDDDKLLVDQRDTLLYGEVRASVPFNWEESPGKPKLKFSERIHNNNLQIVAAAAAANGLPQPTRRLSTEEYVGRWDPALQASPDQLQHLLPTPRHLLPLPPRLKAVKSNLQIAAAAAAADSRVVVVQHRRTSSLDSLPRLHLYKPEAASSSSSSSFPVQQQQQQSCGEEEKPKDFWRRLFKEKLLITRRKTVPKTSLGSAAAGPAGQLLLDAASSWESERAKKTTEEEAAASRPANHHHHHRHQLLLLNGTDEKKWLQQQQQGNRSNVHHHSQQQHLSPSRSNSCRPQSVPQKPIPSIRSPAVITPRGMKATSPVTASGGEHRQQQQQQQQREIMFPYNIRLLTSCLGFPPIKTYRSSSSELRSLVYGSP